VIADTFALWANAGFDSSSSLNLIEAWATSLSYTFQLYFDFSGYTDMAIGMSLLFNIHLPINFNSPYKALSIQDFWRRWHMTLSRFLRDYLYIPLGGNRKGKFRTYNNLIITFILGGLWHGAGWTFVFWGLLHGVALAIHRAWSELGFKMNKMLAWLITFNFINITWVFFRAKEFEDAVMVLGAMFSLENVVLPLQLSDKLSFLEKYGVEFGAWLFSIGAGTVQLFLMMLFAFVLVLVFKNSMEKIKRFKPNLINLLILTYLLYFSLASMVSIKSEFLYFNF
jgi:D-alanyl-lipoteichoic acid acyltransferase DltB (MBOAT superfamily)